MPWEVLTPLESLGLALSVPWFFCAVYSYQALCGSPKDRVGEPGVTPGLQADRARLLPSIPITGQLPAISCLITPFSLQIGHIEGQPERKGVFPVSFVHILSD